MLRFQAQQYYKINKCINWDIMYNHSKAVKKIKEANINI